MPMRIGYDATPWRRYQSGVGRYAASLLQALATQYPEKVFLLFSHLGSLGFVASNVMATQGAAFPIKEIWLQLWLPRIIARCRPELCHFTNTVAPLRVDVPYVVTVHDLSLIRRPEWHPWTRRIWMRRMLRPSIARACGILCDSEATRRDLLGWISLDASKVWVVPLGARNIFHQRFSEERREAIRAKYGLLRPYFFYLGNVEPRKNLMVLLEAFQGLDLPNVDLVIAGKRAWLWKDTIRFARPFVERGSVHLLDYVPDEDLPVLYQSALAFVFPSRMEGFGLPVLEAMASGLPVVASKVEPLVSLVGEAGWLADPEDVSEWRSALRELWRDRQKRDALGVRGKDRAANYTWERTARETMRCYELALSGPGVERV